MVGIRSAAPVPCGERRARGGERLVRGEEAVEKLNLYIGYYCMCMAMVFPGPLWLQQVRDLRAIDGVYSHAVNISVAPPLTLFSNIFTP